MQAPDFISIGHACHDTAPFGFIPGGAVTYSGLFAYKLGFSTGVLTSVGEDYLFKDLFEGINFQNILAEQTTVFQNKYIDEHRQQFLLGRASEIKKGHLPPHWENSKMVFLAPIANEVDLSFLDHFENALVAVSPQGWMRKWDEHGKVTRHPLPDLSVLSKADIVIISEEDVGMDYSIINKIASAVDMLVLTKGKAGCAIYQNDQISSYPAYQTEVIDTTGAGDVFSTAFLIYYYKTQNPAEAAQYANIAASFCIEAKGIEGLPTLEQITRRFNGFRT